MSSFNPFEKEQSIRTQFEQYQTFKFDENNIEKKEIYSIDTPPPTVSGSLHIGHIFSYIQTDVIARYKRIMGFNVLYPFGFDDNGLPTERFVEKKRGITAHTVGRKEFIEACLEETKSARLLFTNLWKKMGLSVDWTKCYSTISKDAQYISQKSFLELYQNGYIYKKKEPALYCTAFRTSVAQAELESVEKETFFSTIIFKSIDDQDILVATTRPEMLYSCVALLVHPNDSRYTHLKNQQAKVPHTNKFVHILEDDKVIPEKGTGIVMCCTFGDTLDVYWFKKHKFEYIQSIGFDGKMTSICSSIAGLSVLEARAKMITILEEENLLIEKKKIVHMISVYERSKKEIEYVLLDQWFLDIMNHKQKLLETVNNIKWHPSHMKDRCINWIKNLEWDWCLSRQRVFGIPFPAWYTADGKIHIANIEDLPLDPQTTKPSYIPDHAIADTDVMDTWNTSSVTPLIVANMVSLKNGIIPMSMRPQAHDIIRTWAFYTITKILYHNEKIAWNNIVISGHVVAPDKQKISKSVGNTPADPEGLLEKYPADVVRYWAAASNLGNDTAFSETEFKNGHKLLMKLYNAGEFIKPYIFKEIPILEINTIKNPINMWILSKLENIQKNYVEHFDEYEYALGFSLVERFFFEDFCDQYIELVKHPLNNASLYDPNTEIEIKKVLGFVYFSILHLMEPVLCYCAEYLYQDIFETKKFLVHKKLEIISIKNQDIFEQNIQKVHILIKAINEVRKIKTLHKTSLKTTIQTLIMYSEDKETIESIKIFETLLKGNINAQNLIYSGDIHETTYENAKFIVLFVEI